MRLALAQMNATVGDFQGNQEKILSAIHSAQAVGADIVVFPELAVCGYPPEDLLHKRHFIQRNIQVVKQVVKKVNDIVAVVGFVDIDEDKQLYNAAVVMHERFIKGLYYKKELPNYGVFDEKRYFKAGREREEFQIGGYRVGINICEDIWADTDIKPDREPDVLVNLSSSPYDIGKPAMREKMLKKRALAGRCHIAYCNLVGGQDELVFDGGSLIFDPKGKCVARGKFCQEDLVVADISPSSKKRRVSTRKVQYVRISSTLGKPDRPACPTSCSPRLSPVARIYQALVLGTRDYIQKNAFRKVVLGLSGGIDSSMVATIAVDAIGAENVVGVSMPSRYTSSETKADAETVARNLNIRLIQIPIEQMAGAYKEALQEVFTGRKEDITEENIQARIRGNLLMALSNKFGWLVLTTGNKSETAVGYCTLYGDMSGGFAVIKDILKTKVYELARYRNGLAVKNLIPSSVLKRPPTAELRPNQKDQDSLPPYATLDKILTGYVEQHKSTEQIVRQGLSRDMVQRVIKLVDYSEYKRRQAPPGIKITSRAFGKDWRLPITNRYKYNH